MYKKRIAKEMSKLTIDVPFNIRYFNEETDEFTTTMEGHVMYIDFVFLKDVHPKIKEDTMIKDIYMYIPDSYPFKPPVIYLGEHNEIQHASIENPDGELCTSEWSPLFDLNQMLWNLYCIYFESLDNDHNININKKSLDDDRIE